MVRDRQQCLAMGMNDYLAKPFTEEQLKTLPSHWTTPKPCDPMAVSASSPGRFTSEPALTPSTETTAYPALDKHAWQAIRELQRPGRADILSRILTQYLDDSRTLIEHIRQAVETGNPTALHEAVHGLKSSSTQVGALATAARCVELETLSRETRLDSAANLIEQLEDSYRSACEAIESELQIRTAR